MTFAIDLINMFYESRKFLRKALLKKFDLYIYCGGTFKIRKDSFESASVVQVI